MQKGMGKNMAEIPNKEVSEQDIENVLKILDNFGKSDTSRLKIDASELQKQGTTRKQYHLGRCDVGSPWARGTLCDVVDDNPEN